ncbi:two-component sensor histidine kinase (plasmid) [Azospirillum lipoferum 4B]|uniref:Oxygen sensor histidine kinase NreB n=2 Tax=Azospirillum lipoferum TaxID=193 RepID=G7Z9T3_AZOL4|nr:two-component sensor histidine kinase [Azospirillum lipoferum 4B]
MADVGVKDDSSASYRLRTADTAPAPGREAGAARLARLLGFKRTIRSQILWAFILINLLACVATSLLIVYNARRATLVEIGASMEMAERLVRTAVDDLQRVSRGGAGLQKLPLRLSGQRHVRILVTTAQGEPVWPPQSTLAQSTPAQPASREGAPDWFASLVGVEVPNRDVPVFSEGRRIGTVTIVSEASDEIAEVWDDMTDLALVALIVNVLVIGVLHVVLGQVLNPLLRVAAGFRELEQGHFQYRLPLPRGGELADIVARFNALASSLAAAQADNLCLNRRLVAVQDSERRQLAVELHDEFGPCLFSLKANVASLARFAEQLPPEIGGAVRERAGTLRDIGERIETTNRRLLKTVRPMALGHVPLADAIAGLLSEFERLAPDCAIEFATGKLAYSYGDPIDLSIYRCVQEGLTNAVRHGGARRIRVEVEELDRPAAAGGARARTGAGCEIRLSVQDDGRGIAVGTATGLGLTGMRERIAALGGSLSISSRSGGGTCLAVAIPLEEDERVPATSATRGEAGQ